MKICGYFLRSVGKHDELGRYQESPGVPRWYAGRVGISPYVT